MQRPSHATATEPDACSLASTIFQVFAWASAESNAWFTYYTKLLTAREHSRTLASPRYERASAQLAVGEQQHDGAEDRCMIMPAASFGP